MSLKEDLVNELDLFVATNAHGYRSRAAVVTDAVRRFLDATPADTPSFEERLYVELAFLLQHAIETGDPKVDPLQRLQAALFEWRRLRLGPK